MFVETLKDRRKYDPAADTALRHGAPTFLLRVQGSVKPLAINSSLISYIQLGLIKLGVVGGFYDGKAPLSSPSIHGGAHKGLVCLTVDAFLIIILVLRRSP